MRLIKSGILFISDLLFLILFASCNGVGTAEFGATEIPTPSIEGPSFAGITSTSNKTDSTITLNWTPHENAVAYNIFNTQSGTAVLLTSVVGQSDSYTTLTGLTPGASYKFRVNMLTSLGLMDTNTNDNLVTMNSAPNIPSALTLISPTSPGQSDTPTISPGC